MNKGFTLVELLVVILIIGVLAAILLPVLNRAQTDAMRADAKVTINQLAQALKMYERDEGCFPEDGKSSSKPYPYKDDMLVPCLDGDTGTTVSGLGGGATQYFEFKPEMLDGNKLKDPFDEYIWYHNFQDDGMTTKSLDSSNPLHPKYNAILFRSFQLYTRANYPSDDVNAEDGPYGGADTKTEATFRWITNYN